MIIFVLRQLRLTEPLFDMVLLRNRPTATSLITLLLMGTCVTGLFYLFTQHLQWVGGLSPLHAGLWTLPYIVFNIAGALLAPAITRRIRPATVVIGGLLVAATGAAFLALSTGAGTALPVLVAAISITGLGQGAAGALLSDLIISSAPEEKTGSAASAQEVGGELGSALGIAAGGAISILAYRHRLTGALPEEVPATVEESAQASIHSGIQTADGLAVEYPELLGVIHDSFSFGFQSYAGLACLLLILTAGLVTVVLRKSRQH